MIKTDFTFGFFKDRFDGPSHPADPHEFVQRRIERCIAEKVFDLSRVIQIATDNQPEFTGRQTPRNSVTRRNAKSQTMGPLLPSLITA